MSYVADSTDVEFAAENQTSTTPTMAAEADLASGGWDPAGASPPHDHGEEEQPYVTPYETFNVDIERFLPAFIASIEEEEED